MPSGFTCFFVSSTAKSQTRLTFFACTLKFIDIFVT
jgi:hypothetical protein